MKKVLVEGYAKNNLGDDLFFSILVKRYLNTHFVFNSYSKIKALRECSNVDTKHYGILSLLRNTQKFDMLVLIGGSMFQEKGRFSWVMGWLSLLLKVLLFRINGKKVVFLGFNFGPYHSTFFLVAYKLMFFFVNDLSVRDKKTFNLFRKSQKIHIFPDIVFSMDDNKLRQSKDKSLAISVMDFGTNTELQKKYELFLEKLIDSIRDDIAINLYGFQISENINDLNAVNRIAKKATRRVNKLCYNGTNMDVFLKKYYRNYFAITTRFHSLVLSLKANQKIISIDYNLKVKSLLETLHIENMDISLNDLKNDSLCEAIAKGINNCDFNRKGYYKYKNNNEMIEIVNNANKHFLYLDDILGDATCGK